MDDAKIILWARNVLVVDDDACLQEIYDKTESMLATCSTTDDVAKTRHAKDVLVALLRAQALINGTGCATMTTEKNTPFQALILFVLQRLMEQKYRRRDDSCYEMVIHNGRFVAAWRKVCSLRDFVVHETRKDIEPEFYRHLISSQNLCDLVVRHVIDSKHVEFPDLCVDENLISWHNGLYNVKHNVFFPFDVEDKWPSLASAVEAERKASGWDCELQVPSSYACHFTNMTFRDVRHHEPVVKEIHKMIEGLGVSNPTWFCAMMGRLLFPINTLDRWQVMLYLRTSCDADSSAFKTFLDIFTACVGESISSISSGTTLEHVKDRRVCIALMRDMPPLEQGDWQLAVCGEHVCLTSGGKPTSFEWTSHILGVGPTLIYKNDAKTVDRRIVMFDITETNSDALLQFREFVIANADVWLQTITSAYLTMAHEYGRQDLWQSDALPPDMHSMRSVVRELSDPLHSCITSDMFVLDPNLYMPLHDFKLIYYEYRRSRNLPQQRWVMQHWQATFHDLQLTIEKMQKEYDGAKSTTDWICGIDTTSRRKRRDRVSADMVESLCTQESKLQKTLANVQAQIRFSRELVEIDEQIDQFKAKRQSVQQSLQELDFESG